MLGFANRVVERGESVIVKDGKFVLGQKPGTQAKTFDRQAVLAIVPGELTESNFWSGKISLGATIRSGNTDSTDANTYLNFKRDYRRWRRCPPSSSCRSTLMIFVTILARH